MVTRTIALGPEFDLFRDDDEETLVGSSSHQGAIGALDDGLSNCAPSRPELVRRQSVGSPHPS